MPNAWGRQRPLHSSGVADPEAQAQAKRQGTGVSAMYDGETTQAVGSRWWVRAKAHPASTVDLSELSESKWVRGSLRMTASSLRRGQVHVGPGGMSTWGYVRRQLKLDFRREIEIISKLRHPNIVTMIGATFQGVSYSASAAQSPRWHPND